MLNILYSEFLKLKRSFFLLLILAGGAFLPLLMLAGHINSDIDTRWASYAGNIEAFMFLLGGVVLFSLATSYIFSREFTDKTAAALYTYPVNRIKILICKLLVIFSIILAVYILQFILTFCGGLLLKHEPLTKEILLYHMKIHLCSMVLQFALIPAVVLIASISKNIIPSIIYGVMAGLSNMFLMESDKYIYSPFMFPVLPLLQLKGAKADATVASAMNFNLQTSSVLYAVAFFTIGLIGCIVYTSKTDIH